MTPDEPITWETNAVAFALPASEAAMFQSFHAELNEMMRHSLDVSLHPWKAADRNPMPRLDWWPIIDRAIWWRSEAPKRLAGALDVLRYGVRDDDGSDW